MKQELAVDWTGMRCPRCRYVRGAADSSHPAECPRCRVPYAEAADLPLRITPGEHGRQMLREAATDASLFVLLATNAIVLAIALHLGMSLRSLMFIYWMQSVVIGACNVARILTLERFSVRGVHATWGELEETPRTKWQIAVFFVVHFGLFHLVYLAFLFLARGGEALAFSTGLAFCGLAFAVNHLFSLRRNMAKDAEGQPNIGTLMFMPYLRIVPMHVMICTGLVFAGGTASIVFFAVLKTIADALMHVVEHHALRTNLDRPRLQLD